MHDEVRVFLALVGLEQRAADELCQLASVFRLCHTRLGMDHVSVCVLLKEFREGRLESRQLRKFGPRVQRDLALLDMALEVYAQIPAASPCHRVPWLVQMHFAFTRAEQESPSHPRGQASNLEPRAATSQFKPEDLVQTDAPVAQLEQARQATSAHAEPPVPHVTNVSVVQCETQTLQEVRGARRREAKRLRKRQQGDQRRLGTVVTAWRARVVATLERATACARAWRDFTRARRLQAERLRHVLHELRGAPTQERLGLWARRRRCREEHEQQQKEAKRLERVRRLGRLALRVVIYKKDMQRARSAVAVWKALVDMARYSALHRELNLIKRCMQCLRYCWTHLKDRFPDRFDLMEQELFQLTLQFWSTSMDLDGWRRLVETIVRHRFLQVLPSLLRCKKARRYVSVMDFVTTLETSTQRFLEAVQRRPRRAGQWDDKSRVLTHMEVGSVWFVRWMERNQVPRFFFHLELTHITHVLKAWFDNTDSFVADVFSVLDFGLGPVLPRPNNPAATERQHTLKSHKKSSKR